MPLCVCVRARGEDKEVYVNFDWVVSSAFRCWANDGCADKSFRLSHCKILSNLWQRIRSPRPNRASGGGYVLTGSGNGTGSTSATTSSTITTTTYWTNADGSVRGDSSGLTPYGGGTLSSSECIINVTQADKDFEIKAKPATIITTTCVTDSEDEENVDNGGGSCANNNGDKPEDTRKDSDVYDEEEEERIRRHFSGYFARNAHNNNNNNNSINTIYSTSDTLGGRTTTLLAAPEVKIIPAPPTITTTNPIVSSLVANNATSTTSTTNLAAATTTTTTATRMIAPRYRFRDLLLGDFSFNDDGERWVEFLLCCWAFSEFNYYMSGNTRLGFGLISCWETN